MIHENIKGIQKDHRQNIMKNLVFIQCLLKNNERAHVMKVRNLLKRLFFQREMSEWPMCNVSA